MADAFTTEAFTLLGVGVTVVALRTYSRLTAVGIRKFQADDYLMLFATNGSSAHANKDPNRFHPDWHYIRGHDHRYPSRLRSPVPQELADQSKSRQ
ncbi:MAG: hypothetical protein Q9178_006696 [Gyalolechia marmorata]